MHIEEELEGGVLDFWDGVKSSLEDAVVSGRALVSSDADGVSVVDLKELSAGVELKRILVGAGARLLFYPTLCYNVIRYTFEADFRWWDRIDEFVLLGAVPFCTDVPVLKDLGVRGVITLNESYETLVPDSLYSENGIDHLVIPTRDYLFAPSMSSICNAVDFIHRKSLCGHSTYVHCKAGRGRSTTIVICYLVKHKQMTPDAAFSYVRSIRPRVLLASAQRQAVERYYHIMVKGFGVCAKSIQEIPRNPIALSGGCSHAQNGIMFDDGSSVVVTDTDLEGYDAGYVTDALGGKTWSNLHVAYTVRVASEAVLEKISWMWVQCRTQQKISGEKFPRGSSCSTGANQLAGVSVDIHVY